jgi:CBS domain containing-hemolysin-like protein
MLTRLLAVGLQLVKQPRVIAEVSTLTHHSTPQVQARAEAFVPLCMVQVIGGILLGPSFFGALVPGFASTVFPKSSLPMLTLVANLGLVLYLFLVGIELDPRTMVRD